MSPDITPEWMKAKPKPEFSDYLLECKKISDDMVLGLYDIRYAYPFVSRQGFYKVEKTAIL